MYAYVASVGLNVRSGPSSKNRIVTELRKGNQVQIIGNTGSSNWSKIRFGTYEGYVDKNYLKDYHKVIQTILITSIKVGNSTKDNKWINQPGQTLYAKDILYLFPVITYNSSFNGQATFYVKIIKPDGEIKQNPDISPAGYTYSTAVSVTEGENKSLDLGGWGKTEGGLYSAGEWTIEVWYEGVCLCSEKIRLN
jgi:hypothetical protein